MWAVSLDQFCHDVSMTNDASRHPTFEDFQTELERLLGQTRAALDAHAEFPHLDAFALRLTHCLGRGGLALPPGEEGRALKSIVGMFTNQLWAFSATVRAGALYGAWHHVRAVLEIHASLHYLFADEASKQRRIQQFLAFADMRSWVAQQKLERARDAKKITPGEFEIRNVVPKEVLERFTDEVVESWCQLFGRKTRDALLKKHYWHDDPMETLIDRLDPSGGLYSQYEFMCHATHVSSFGYALSSPGGPRMIGFDQPQLELAVGRMFATMLEVLEQLDQLVGGSLMTALQDEMVALGKSLIAAGRISIPDEKAQQ